MTSAVRDDVEFEVVADSGPAFAPPVEDAPPAVQATVELRGRRFPVRAEGVSLLALMKFATVAKRQQQRRDAGGSVDDMDGLDALYSLIRSCVDPASWDEFEQHGIDTGASADDLMRVVRDAVQAAAARPTLPPSGSPDGQSTTAPSSAAGSSSPASSGSSSSSSLDVQRSLEQRGRPDIARVVQIARQNGVGR